MSSKTFLSAQWEYLALFNYEVDADVLKKYLPPFTQIDYFNGKALVSIVGFMFNNTKVMGIKWPGHVNFEEVNLRFYVKHFDGTIWKRGVAFISEIVPKFMIVALANTLYNEQYCKAKMNHSIAVENDVLKVAYHWKTKETTWNLMQLKALPILQNIEIDSEAEFILEHYFGYNMLHKNTTIEYAVNHPRWQIYPVSKYELQCDIEKLYGKEFVPFITNKKPQSVLLAKGSSVTVNTPLKIRK